MWWIVGGLAAWLVIGLLFAVVVGRGIRLADERSPGATDPDLLIRREPPVTAGAGPSRRPLRAAVHQGGAVPLPPVAVAMAAVALGLELVGYAIRLTGATGPIARLFSMDGHLSVPRLFVAGIFAVAAFAAVAGAAVNEGRRTWWLTVGMIAAAISAVKLGSTLHSDALGWLVGAVGEAVAALITALMAAAVIGLLWVLSRDERRDRRRLLMALSFYAFAVVGLSTVSRLVSRTYGYASDWAAAATFVEESGEALAAITYVVAVLVGVAPRLVLPARWALRRADDAHGLEATESLVRSRLADPRSLR